MKTTLQYEIRHYGVLLHPDPKDQNKSLRIRVTSNWSGLYFELADFNPNLLQGKLALIAKLYKLAKLPADCSMSMLALKTVLQSMGAVQVCQDERTGKLHTQEKMPDPFSVSYVDDCKKMELQYNSYHVLAIGPSQAQRLILADAAANGASDSWIEKFVSAGMPVTVKYNAGNAPVWLDWQV